MLIHLNKNYLAGGKTGKCRFSQRLTQAWHDMGVQITDDPEIHADIALHIGRFNYPSKAKKHVIRVGPANIDTNMNWKKINREKAKSVKRCDGIVYQSRYSRKIYRKLVCKPDIPEAVIFNGANPKDYEVEPYESNFKYNFLASTRVWIRQKRLKDIIKSFLLADIPDSCLLVNGDTQGVEKKYDRDNIMFFGPVSDKVLARMYKLATALVHITWLDACPTSVVESLVAGCPVIHSNMGGTRELTALANWEAATHLRFDPDFDYKPKNLSKPPKSERMREMLGEAMKAHIATPRKVEVPYLHIDSIAKQYLTFFKEVVA